MKLNCLNPPPASSTKRPTMNRFQAALNHSNTGRPPVWFMRQAGRYHSHYQELKREHSFVDLCKIPKLACEVALGPVEDFGFDAAILFSDLLFPLEVMGQGLRYDPGPKLEWHLRFISDLRRFRQGNAADLGFQGEAVRQTRRALPSQKGLLGFVGGPLTLFVYAVEGSHKGELDSAIAGLSDGRFEGFCDLLIELLAEAMADQFRAGADTVAVLDTCAGDIPDELFQRHGISSLNRLFEAFRRRCPDAPITYYSRHTGPSQWSLMQQLPVSCFGVDWHHPMPEVMELLGDRWSVQGNVDPEWLLLPTSDLETRLRQYFETMQAVPQERRTGWICGLGHGVLPKTPEANVRLFLQLQHELLSHCA